MTLQSVCAFKKSLSLSWNIQQNQFHIVQTVKLSSSVMIWNVRLISLFFSFIFSCTQYSHIACGKYIWAGLSHWFIVFQTVVDGCLHFNYPHRNSTGNIISVSVAALGHHIPDFPEENESNLKQKWHNIDSTLIAGRKLEAETISAVIGFLASIDPVRQLCISWNPYPHCFSYIMLAKPQIGSSLL